MANTNVTNINYHNLSKSAVEQSLCGFNYEEVLSLLFSYFKKMGKGNSIPKKSSSMVVLQQKLLAENIRNYCPYCGSATYVKNGFQATGLSCFKCKECGRKFNIFTGSILEKTRFQWNLWVKVLEMTINDYSVRHMRDVLEQDYGCKGIRHQTVWQWRMKLIHSLAQMPQPQLKGVIQIDETYFRESQKGSRHLVNYLPHKYCERVPRYGELPSLLGIMSPEFCTVVTAIDDRGYSVCKLLSMGKMAVQAFYDNFDSYIQSPTYICTDGYEVYEKYCQEKLYKHYIKPSEYDRILLNHGCIPLTAGRKCTKDDSIENFSKRKALYNQGMIDKFSTGKYSYEMFCDIKKTNHLSLARVNELHSELKKYINTNMTNVSSKYLQDYIGFYTYIRNWGVEHKRKPTSNTDAMEIFMEILKYPNTNYTKNEINNSKLTLPKPTGRYIQMLKEKTELIRKSTGNNYFKFNSEDGVYNFNKREYLKNQPISKLKKIMREHGKRNYSKWNRFSLSGEIMKMPDIEDIIVNLIAENDKLRIDNEDKKAGSVKAFLP